MAAMVGRGVPSRLAGIVEALELEQPAVVTVEDLSDLAATVGLGTSGAELGYELRRLGWLLPLRTRGAWEFAPAARAGRFRAGDRHIELRATLAVDPNFPGVLAMESAAVLLGFAGHVPEREVLAVPRGYRVPKALRDWRMVGVELPGDPAADRGGLRVWRVEALLAGMALRPDGYRDWGNVAQWLDRAVDQVDGDRVARLLREAPRAAWHRAGYLFAQGGNVSAGVRLLDQAPPGRGPVHLGARDRHGRFDAQFQVIDSVLVAGKEAVQP